MNFKGVNKGAGEAKDEVGARQMKEEEADNRIDANEMLTWGGFETTEQIKVPKKLINQVIGQGQAVETIKKAAKQRRHILLIGEPGTGKSMMAQAMAELLPREELTDILALRNPDDSNNPKIEVIPAGEGRKKVQEERERASVSGDGNNKFKLPLLVSIFFLGPLALYLSGVVADPTILFAMWMFGAFIVLFTSMNIRSLMMGGGKSISAKLLVDNGNRTEAPFYDGTGAHAGALLGDVKHDPLQSGGLGTPAHLRILSGMIHKANKGVLFIDEIGTLGKSQQDLLTAMQEKKLAITGRSEMSSGAMVMTDPVPCDFVLIAAGNFRDIEHMHPALRSRIRGYGYEVYMLDTIEDTDENRKKMVQFIAQEVSKDEKIPHFTREAVEEVIREARRKSGTRSKLTLRFRELGGLVRAAGDIALEKGHNYVLAEDVLEGKKAARTLEQQVGDIYLDKKKEYSILITEGSKVGRVNGLAVMGEGGTVLPIVAEVAPAHSLRGGTIIATGKLGEIAKEAVSNVSAIIKKFSGQDISNYDIHIQFLQTYEGVEGDSASISVAVAVISAIEHIGINQGVAMTGSLSVRGEVLPVGGITQKIEAAADAGIRRIIIPKSNEKDILLEKKYEGKIEILTSKTLIDVLENSLDGGEKIMEKMRGIID